MGEGATMPLVRVSGGSLSGRTLVAPAGAATRPTSDKVRQAVFNVLVHADVGDVDPLSGAVLDLYAGSGALGIEALSRGATRCDFVDGSGPACTTIEQNLATLGLGDRGRVHRSHVDRFCKRATPGYTLLFADPPYADAGAPLDRVLTLVLERELVVEGGLFVVEHAPKPRPAAQPGLELLDERTYGQTVVSFLRVQRRGTRSDP